ncbi:ABC transporter substrate-binding protein [Cohnella phaseoli]|uniref:Putative aldouronate transport system substrate-binding protein n=1 Tax=Cohnella phaseoli TaxID=456490 RepID=A0A3D9IU03_9BACL|nr:ABC transporter substrate-binding protein [Cohnella phaseoli]RED65283.1 putative aldouronate transport system substrate-binding protein [Cohnella phaseoli]
MKKGLGITVVLMLVMTLVLSACTGNNGNNGSSLPPSGSAASPESSSSGNADSVTGPGELPITKEKTTIKIMTHANSLVEDFATNAFTKYLEEKTNIHIEWDILPEKSASEKLNLVLASGEDLPDVIMTMGISPAQQMIFGSQGLFRPLNDLIEQYGTETNKIFEAMPYVKDTITAPDGNIYAMPAPNEGFHAMFMQKMWIYKPWLDKLGLAMPTTTEEFYNVLQAFKTKDPNGNGKADEIPFSGSPTGYLTQVHNFLLNSFTYSPMSWLTANNGKIEVPYNKPEWKEGLKYLRRLYADGLMDAQALTQDGNQLKQLGENPDVPILGAVSTLHMGEFTQFFGESGRWLEYVAVPPLKGPAGVQVTPYDPYGVLNTGAYVITKDAKNPEAAFRLLDFMYNTETTLRSSYGEPGSEWEWAKDGEIGINGEQAVWKALKSWGNVQNVHWSLSGPIFNPSTLRLSQVDDPTNPLEKMLYTETKEKYDPYKAGLDQIVPPLYLSDEDSSEIADLQLTLHNRANEMLVRSITGDVDIDKEWDAYVSSLNDMNLARYLELYQKAYDAKK